MSAHTRKLRTKPKNNVILTNHAGNVYRFPKQIAEKYRIDKNELVNADQIFAKINKKYTKPGALLRGTRARENLTQADMAKKINVTQSDISQMENGSRKIGRTIAKRIEKLFDVDYRSFLE